MFIGICLGNSYKFIFYGIEHWKIFQPGKDTRRFLVSSLFTPTFNFYWVCKKASCAVAPGEQVVQAIPKCAKHFLNVIK